jgi:predicted membrane metal-binding protein
MGHENLNREETIEGSSDRSFGLIFAVVFAIIAAWPLMSARPPRWWALAIALGFALVAVVAPKVLAPLNRWWMKFGLLLAHIVSPIALAILFYAVFTPIGVLMRLLGKDPLKLARDKNAATYWTTRTPPGPRPDSMKQQF